MSFMGKCCSCYHRKANKYEPIKQPYQQSQFYCCEHSKSTLIRNNKSQDASENQENCSCNKMQALDVAEEVTQEMIEKIKSTDEFIHVEKDEYCKVWSEHKLRKEWTEENVAVPFNKKLKDPLETGLSLIIQGQVKKVAGSFTVNFVISSEDEDDIALHFNPRFDVNYCVRTTRKNGHWAEEERAAYVSNPFKLGENFVLEIFCAPQEFMIAVNGTHFCNFSYKYPLYSVTRLQILPQVDVYKVQTKLLHIYPSALQEDLVPQLASLQLYPHHPLGVEKFHVAKDPPLVFLLNNKLSVGTMVEICGRVKLLPHTFFINLQHGKLLWPHPNISFHTSVRFKYKAESVHKVVCNSYHNEVWGNEEIPDMECPYDPGRAFTMKIFMREDHFNVLIDDELFINYKYRDDVTLVNTIYISGDVFIESVHVKN